MAIECTLVFLHNGSEDISPAKTTAAVPCTSSLKQHEDNRCSANKLKAVALPKSSNWINTWSPYASLHADMNSATRA